MTISEGIAKAKSEGRYRGRAPTVRRQTGAILELHAAGISPTHIAKRLGVGRASIYRVLAVAAG
jgi:DNA invertase Pin-like site-specific DNA recombinase